MTMMDNPSNRPETGPEGAPGKSPRRRLALAGLLGLTPLIPIAIAIIIIGGGAASAGTTTTTPASNFKPLSTKVSTQQNLLIPPGKGALVALVQHATEMRSSPGGHVYAKVPLRTEFGSPVAMWVVRTSGPWLGVISPIAGNGNVGWIPAAVAALGRVNWKIQVTLSKRQLTVLHGGRAVAHFTIAVGAPTAPTPTGRFAVTDRLNTGDPTGPYGCCILALSAEAPHAIQDWSGGNRIAIHSTPETSSIGQPVSHGCMRLTLPEGRWLLNHIPLGTPTVIRSD
jgi:lipoprotein-anchoring transpeptidase ErfK/SrfK